MAPITPKKQRKRKVSQLSPQKCDQISNSSPSSPTPPRTPLRIQAPPHKKNRSTGTRYRYFQAVDDRALTKLDLGTIARRFGIDESTGRAWRRDRTKFGLDVAGYRHRIRKRKPGSGGVYRLPDDTIDKLLDPAQNKKRSERYSEQIEAYNLPVTERTLQENLVKRRKAKRFKKRKIKAITPENKGKRVEYGVRNGSKCLAYWATILFTDEAHYDPDAEEREYVLRMPGTATEPDNLQEMQPKGLGNALHFGASVSWFGRSELLFYNDDGEIFADLKTKDQKGKPRKRKKETNDEFEARYTEWEAALPPPKDVIVKGNHMTQRYYTTKILPHYIAEFRHWKHKLGKALLQEDNDPSHGTRTEHNYCWRYKRKEGILDYLIVHPAQSPDLNPIEGIWNILKQRVRKRRKEWSNVEELKAILRDEWSKIDQNEIRARIREMRKRCEILQHNGGRIIKSELW